MKAIHKNSREEFNLEDIIYTKFFGMYGYLVLTSNKEIIFITSVSNQTVNYMTEEFEIKE